MKPETAIAEYHDLIGRGSLALDSQAMLDTLQEHRGLSFGTRSMPHLGHLPGCALSTSGCIGQV